MQFKGISLMILGTVRGMLLAFQILMQAHFGAHAYTTTTTGLHDFTAGTGCSLCSEINCGIQCEARLSLSLTLYFPKATVDARL